LAAGRGRRLLSAFIILLAVAGMAHAAYYFEYEVAILYDILDSLARGDSEGFAANITWYERIEPPSEDLALVRREIVDALHAIAQTLFYEYSGDPCQQTVDFEEAKAAAAEWARFKHELLPAYYSIGSPYVGDRGLFFLLQKNITVVVEAIDEIVSGIVARSLEPACDTNPLNVTVEPGEVMAGSNFSVLVEAPGHATVTARITVYVEDLIYETRVVEVRGAARVSMRAPGFEELDAYAKRIAVSTNSVRLTVLVEAAAGNATYRGVDFARVVFTSPTVYVACSERIVVGGNATVYIVNMEPYTLNATVSVANVTERIVLAPGLTTLVVASDLLGTPGFYTVTVAWEGAGRILPGARECTIAVVDPIDSATISASTIVVPPFVPLRVSGVVNVAEEYNGSVPVAVFLGDSLVALENVSNHTLYLEANVNKLLPSVEVLRVVYYAGAYQRPLLEAKVIIINPLFLALAALTVAAGHAGGDVGLRELARGAVLALGRVPRVGRRGPQRARLFAGIVSAVEDLVPPPRPSETLREYLKRAEEVLPERVYGALEAAVLAYEALLYSPRGRDPRVVGEVKRLLNHLKRVASGGGV